MLYFEAEANHGDDDVEDPQKKVFRACAASLLNIPSKVPYVRAGVMRVVQEVERFCRINIVVVIEMAHSLLLLFRSVLYTHF